MPEASAATDLIERAFALAHQSGKSDWWVMTIPVLKNRLLLLTNRTFKEADYGASTFRDFLSKVQDFVKITDAPPPGFVILRSAAPGPSEEPTTTSFRAERVRPDLWRAALDYASGLKYVWDASAQTARPARTDENEFVLPTASADDIDNWRAEFVASQKSPTAELASVLEEWREKGLPTAALPAAMRPAWNKHLKRKVEQRLKQWFDGESLRAPEIIEQRHQFRPTENQVEALRDFVIACVQAMSKQELLELRISPETAMRVTRPQTAARQE